MICIKFTDELTIRDIHLSNVCVPYGTTLQDIMLDILRIEYPELRFYTIMDDFKYEICSCGYLNDVNNEYCYMCGSKRSQSKLSKFLKRKRKPALQK